MKPQENWEEELNKEIDYLVENPSINANLRVYIRNFIRQVEQSAEIRGREKGYKVGVEDGRKEEREAILKEINKIEVGIMANQGTWGNENERYFDGQYSVVKRLKEFLQLIKKRQ
jgi:argonaute-like protein implicated in RNA metabolism and viral defense